MAEFVERKIEEMIPEIEELQRLEILTAKETKKLILKRRDFEYKVHKQSKEMQDFIDYVMFDINLSELIKIRRQKMTRFKNFDKIERVMHERILSRLRRMSVMWPHYPSIWKLRISFALSRKLYGEVSVAYSEQIKFLGGSENVWIAWAQWEMEMRKNFDKARSILLSMAPLYHPSSLNITKEYFRLELLYIEHLKQRSKDSNIEGLEEIIAENRNKVLNAGVPEVIYENAIEKFNSPIVYLEFYNIAKKFPFARALRDKIIRNMMEKFPDDENVWKLKARMVLDGIRFPNSQSSDGSQEEKEEDNDDADEYFSPKEKLESLLELYGEALGKIGPSFLGSYFEDIFHALDEVWGVDELENIIKKNLLQVFNENASSLTPEQFLIWYTLSKELEEEKSEQERILTIAKDIHQSSELLQLYALPYSSEDKSVNWKMAAVKELSGKMSLRIFTELLNRIKPEKGRKKLYEAAFNHQETSLAKAVRVQYMETLKNIDDCRKFYEKFKCAPPFCVKFHHTMLKKELEITDVSVSHVRTLFNSAIELFGKSNPGLWLCYVEFEKKYGQLNKASRLEEEADKKLNPEHLNNFVDCKFYIQQQTLSEEDSNEEFFVDCPSEKCSVEKYEFWARSSLPPIFEEEITRPFSVEKRRREFFDSLVKIYQENGGKADKEENHEEIWEEILTLIHRRKICLKLKKVEESGREKLIENFAKQTQNKIRKSYIYRKGKLSDQLQHGELGGKKISVDREVQKLLDSSEVLKPEFMNQKQLIPYYLSKKKAKAVRKREKEKDSGKNWFNMKAPEKTPELKRDLEILKMRSVLDPERHYKRNLWKETPKYFQMGKVVDSPVDFYSSRLVKKERKRNLAEEIMNNEEVLRYQKRKYNEIVETKQSKRRKLDVVQKSMKIKRKLKSKKYLVVHPYMCSGTVTRASVVDRSLLQFIGLALWVSTQSIGILKNSTLQP